MIDLPEHAVEELKTILQNDLDDQTFKALTDNDIQQIGCFVLQVMATVLKKHVREGK